MTRKFRQVAIPGDKANWIEYFYTGSLPVRNGVVETDKKDWINQLLATGWREIFDEPTVETPQETAPQATVQTKPATRTQTRTGKPATTRARTARTR